MSLHSERVLQRLEVIRYHVEDAYARTFYRPPMVMSVADTIDAIVSGGRSISRFGDGEMDIMRGYKLRFQDVNPQLAKRLHEVFATHESGLLIGVPDVFSGFANMNEHAHWFHSSYVKKNRLAWYRAMDMSFPYANTFMTRFYVDWVDKSNAESTVARLRRMWNGRDVTFVEGEESRLGVGNDLFDNVNSVRRIICPKRNAFDRYPEILGMCSALPKDTLIIAALGPTATVLAYDMYRMGYQALDLGHVDIEYEWMRMRATSKVPVANKYVNEVTNGVDVGNLLDEKYHGEVIARFT